MIFIRDIEFSIVIGNIIKHEELIQILLLSHIFIIVPFFVARRIFCVLAHTVPDLAVPITSDVSALTSVAQSTNLLIRECARPFIFKKVRNVPIHGPPPFKR